MSRDQLEQFVRKLKGAPKAKAGQGQEIEVKRGQSPKNTPAPNLPASDLAPLSSLGSGNVRKAGTVARDQIHDNFEAGRIVVPPELRARSDEYRNALSRSRTLNPVRTAPASGSKGR